ncbi:hypothetical protein KUCAC02_015921 [Chaenocephalus aceratus]|uniref:Uncharacterized protein n=1 Tax=Chaenocephalus aceratus TaxID=36190 RepID=A0ACB9Y0S0_CHAAC|nr:hypothetical protein KUCAC02_015921 [Chaenocephalus aceratus]
MDEKIPEENGEMLPAHVEKEEEMEVTMTPQLEHPIVTPGNADISNTETHMEETTATLSLQSVCKTEACEDKESDRYTHTHTHTQVDKMLVINLFILLSSSSSSSSSPSPPVLVEDDDDEGFSQPAPIKTRDEVLLEELPAVEEVLVSLPEDAELKPVGTVSSIIQQLVIIQSLKDTPPLTDDSVIFTSDRLAVGKVFEVFGPVSSPLYILRFSSEEQIRSKGLTEGLTLYYTPSIKEYAKYILTQQLQVYKGSDASWKNDQEPPAEALDYSDDEKEHEAKRKGKNARKKRANNQTGISLTVAFYADFI